MPQKREGMSSGTCIASGRAPSQAMEMLQPHPASSGTMGWGAKEGLVLPGCGTWTRQGEQAGTVHSHGSLTSSGEARDIWGQDLLSCHAAKTGEIGNEI